MIRQIQNTIVEHWNRPAISDYRGERFLYSDVARHIAQLHAMFGALGIQRGDRIALCGSNSARWGVAFMAVVTYGGVAVPVFSDFLPDQIHHIVNHSETKLLFAAENILAATTPEEMPALRATVRLKDFTMVGGDAGEVAVPPLPVAIGQKDVSYRPEQDENQVMMINYTSGTTGFSKGVMLPYRAFDSNYEFASKALSCKIRDAGVVVSLLPMAHMYGLMFDFIYPFLRGSHTCLIARTPTPAILTQAFAEMKPDYITAVPLVIEKIIRRRVMRAFGASWVARYVDTPIVGGFIRRMVRQRMMKAFGGRIYEVIIGGAALNQEVEAFLRKFRFPFTVGYGATECAPLIAYSDYHEFVAGSCGRCVVNMEVRTDSGDPQNTPGEILVRGRNVMLGYYKNPEATAEALDGEGWYHTGDLGTIDADGNIFIRGRKKSMLLGPNGQNIYPEEIEDKINSLYLVGESLVVQRGNHLEALVYPDYDEARAFNLTDEHINNVLELGRKDLNEMLPAYERIQKMNVQREEFQKTPKRSIKRFLYK